MGKVKSSINVDLDDPRTGKIAEAISNKSCKKILALLADKEMSQKDISDKLGMPLNTVEYSLKKLIDAGLVEKSKNFFWSVKGKKIPMYRVADKKIIISPKTMVNKVVVPAILVLGAIFLAVILFTQTSYPNTQSDDFIGMKNFESYAELREFLKENSADNDMYYRSFGVAEAAVASDAPMPSSGADKIESASDFSTTNVVVEGVDELDIVKNDGSYIYTVVDNKVVIAKAFPAEDLEIMAELEFNKTVTGIFVNGDKLIVVESFYGYGGIYYGVASILPTPERSEPVTLIHVYDITDRENPEPEETFTLSGSYNDARMIDDKVYILSTTYIDANAPVMPFFAAGDVESEVKASDISYPNFIDSSFVFTSIMAIDIDSLEYKGDVYLTGGSSTIHVSKDNIYLTNFKNYNWQDYQEGYYEEVVLDFLPGDVKNEIKDVLSSDIESYEKSQEIEGLMAEYFNSLPRNERQERLEDMQEAAIEYSTQWSKDNEKTVIHKISVDGLEIEYEGSGEVPGSLLNEFSISEYGGNLRIATTTGNLFGSGETLNHLYVLDEDLEIIGSVEDLAEGERIYSARFMGDKAYMVTYRQVDPLYAIDLSDPSDPQVLGYLKIPGFSNYLHPYDENHLIGIGRDADENGRTRGVKVSLFDVSDSDNIAEVDSYVIESEWSYSTAEYEHKAVLFDKEKGILVIPVSRNELVDEKRYEYSYWSGAYVFDITSDNIDLKGTIEHQEESEQDYNYYTQIHRSLFMDDALYTVSYVKIKANEIDDLDEISEVELPYEFPEYYY